MKRKQFMRVGALAMSVIVLMSGMPVYASTDEVQNVTDNVTSDAIVKTHLDSYFKVTLPKTIDANISGGMLSDDYKIKVQGDIAGDELVSVVPDKTFQLKQAGKDAVVVNVTQDKTKFIFSDISGEGATTGHLTSEKLTAGDWAGTMSFTIAKTVVRAPGLYDADGNRLCSWEESGIDVSKNTNGYDYMYDTSSAYSVLQARPEVKSIVVPKGITRIGNYAFYNCSGLTSITIPDTVTNIGESAFYNCSGLTSITIPDTVTSIGHYAFQGCTGLTSITIPNSVTSIGEYAFSGCTGLTSITIPDSVTSIGTRAFQGCSGLTSITIPDSVTSIGYSAFGSCTNLVSVTYKGQTYTSTSALTTALTDNNVTVDDAAFYNTALTD